MTATPPQTPPPPAQDASRRLRQLAGDLQARGVYPIRRDIAQQIVAGADIEARDYWGRTPLLLCLSRPPSQPPIPSPYYDTFHATLGALLQHGADMDAVDDHGNSVDTLAARHDAEYDQTRAMIVCERQRRADPWLMQRFKSLKTSWLRPDAGIEKARTAFFQSIILDAPDEMEYILHLHPEALHWRNDKGHTGLHLAMRHFGGGSTVDILLAAGAEVDARADDGSTPLMLACTVDFISGRQNYCATLIAAGADERLKNDQGQTAMDIAKNHGPGNLTARHLQQALDDRRARSEAETTRVLAHQKTLSARGKKGGFKL